MGGSTTAVLILDTVVDEKRKEMADRVAPRFPARLCTGDRNLLYLLFLPLEFDCFCFLGLMSVFVSSLFHMSLFRCPSLCLLGVASVVQWLSIPLQHVRFLLHPVDLLRPSYPVSFLGFISFRFCLSFVLIFLFVLFCCVFVTDTFAPHLLPCLVCDYLGFFSAVCGHNLYI